MLIHRRINTQHSSVEMAAAAGIIDPTKVGKYPVVLSDALLGKRSSEVYTGVKCKRYTELMPVGVVVASWHADLACDR